ncbi:MAG: MBL fold metallo-hydrolase [Pseudomonadota bacterium]
MKIRLFQSAHGDCLLLEGSDGARLLSDGGIKGSFRKHVLPRLADDGLDVDLLCVSHIDQDHIGGVLAFLENQVNWRVFRHRQSKGVAARPPREVELPAIGEIWHNAFLDTRTKNRAAIERFLALSGEILSGHPDDELRGLAARYRDLAASVGEGIEVSRRISAEQLNIPLNTHWGGKFVTRPAEPEPVQLGSLTLNVLGPTVKEIRELRKFWDNWLRTRREQILKLRKRMQRDESRLAEGDAGFLFESAAELAAAFGLAELGDRGKVTQPNLASIMLHVADANGKTCLLTGDGHMDDVEKGLEKSRLLERGEGLHVNCLKIAHHGSEYNSELRHYQRITANHYVFCGNGHSHNPDPRIVDAVIDSRLGTSEQRSRNSKAGRSFKLWFNANPDDPDNAHAEHVQALRDRVQQRAAGSNGKLRFSFHKGSLKTIRL